MNAVVALCHFCEVHGPQILMATQPFRTQERVAETEHVLQRSLSADGKHQAGDCSMTKDREKCEACQFVPAGHLGFISHDREAGVSYVTMQYPEHPRVYALVREACVRSLSCEVCPGREGPIFFGEDGGAEVLSYTFYVKDTNARGLQRLYSIVVLMMDRVYLLNSWNFLTPGLQRLVTGLQVKGDRVFQEENLRCPQRSFRLSGAAYSAPGNVRQPRSPLQAARSLKELTGDGDVDKRLHAWFAWLLRACGERLTERLMEGPPSEDAVIDWERQEETEEGFIQVFMRRVSTQTELEDSGASDDNLASLPPPADDDGTPPAFAGVRDVFRALGVIEFNTLAYHVLVGYQLIVRCNNRAVTKSFIRAVEVLLPKGCARAVYSHQYEDSWRCNLLGLPLTADLPTTSTNWDYCITLDMQEPPSSCTPPAPHAADYSDWMIQLHSRMPIPDKVPTILTCMQKAIMDTNIEPSVLNHCLICLKEEWMSKVKVFFKLSRGAEGGAGRTERVEELLAAVKAGPHDHLLLKFWVQGLSARLRTYMLSASANHT